MAKTLALLAVGFLIVVCVALPAGVGMYSGYKLGYAAGRTEATTQYLAEDLCCKALGEPDK